MKRFVRGHYCFDCEMDIPQNYMVHDEVWELAGLASNGGLLCFDCLENRLGRKLTIDDFSDKPINAEILFGYKLRGEENNMITAIIIGNVLGCIIACIIMNFLVKWTFKKKKKQHRDHELLFGNKPNF
jgi:hypothetical protein